ncbi:hypothetical protein DPMN_077917 [Dreissena polymorpha]|uniref:Uncharacterized protein n=1 Tax=Dreissena polymorpha TaxID=45954 RepID=A0A9D3YQ64_DREPO|nr:hypothetical protein DPMN_077917 [Dreissena polymorpha]
MCIIACQKREQKGDYLMYGHVYQANLRGTGLVLDQEKMDLLRGKTLSNVLVLGPGKTPRKTPILVLGTGKRKTPSTGSRPRKLKSLQISNQNSKKCTFQGSSANSTDGRSERRQR